MTPEEAYMVAKVVSTADGRCSCCVSSLGELLAVAFPGFDWKDLAEKAEKEYEALGAEYVAHNYDWDFSPDRRFIPTT